VLGRGVGGVIGVLLGEGVRKIDGPRLRKISAKQGGPSDLGLGGEELSEFVGRVRRSGGLVFRGEPGCKVLDEGGLKDVGNPRWEKLVEAGNEVSSELNCFGEIVAEHMIECLGFVAMTEGACCIRPSLSAGFCFMTGGGELTMDQFNKMIVARSFEQGDCFLEPLPLDCGVGIGLPVKFVAQVPKEIRKGSSVAYGLYIIRVDGTVRENEGAAGGW